MAKSGLKSMKSEGGWPPYYSKAIVTKNSGVLVQKTEE